MEIRLKKVTLLATVVLALAMSAGAQQLIDFTQLSPGSGSPQVVPLGYAGLRWDGIFFVSAPLYLDSNLYLGANGAINSGPGFYTGPEALLAFSGGPMCFQNYGAPVADGVTDNHICQSSISAWQSQAFHVDTAMISDGWNATGDFITVTAYMKGVQVGKSFRYKLTTTARKLDFSGNGWGDYSELVFHPSPGGSFVIYTLQVN